MNARKNRRMSRGGATILAVIMTFLTVLSIGSTVQAEAVQGTATKRAIYVVFDNSGSMYGPGNKAWSQATYAMEVFASMLNFENGDVMKVFPMHDVTTEGNSGTNLTSSITITSQDDIAQVHNMYTPSPGGTPYTQVNNANTELNSLLEAGTVDVGWLVVLTDGDFDSDIPADGLRADLSNKATTKDNLNVQYIAIGSDVKNVPEGDGTIGFFAQKAADSAEVVNVLAEISNRIFKRNEYTGYEEGGKLEFDIPLSKVIVFAQGKEVSINGMKNKEGGEVKLQNCLNVAYSNTNGAGLTSYVTETPTKDTTLKGQVAVFADSSAIMEGTYDLDVTGADSVQIYYEPDVKFGVGLFKGDEQVEDSSIEGGAYTLKIGFINRLSEEFIESSDLLGEPEYTVLVNGEEVKIDQGGTVQEVPIELDTDQVEIEASVTYLDNYTDTAGFSAAVCTLDMSVEAPSKVKVKELEDGSGDISVSVTKNNSPLTEEQWDKAIVTVKAVDAEAQEFQIDWEVKKGSEVSTWVISPKHKDGDLYATGVGAAEITIDVSTDIEGETYGRSQTVTMDIQNDKTIVDFIKRYWKQIVISLIFMVILLGYVPPFKKRFPRNMKKRPSIEGTAEKVGLKDMLVKGNFEKNFLSVILPYKAETGRLNFSPTPVKKTANVRATGGGSMVITNTKTFEGKDEITFNGMSIPQNYKGYYTISSSTIMVVATPEYTYTCIPNTQRTPDGKIKKAKAKKKK